MPNPLQSFIQAKQAGQNYRLGEQRLQQGQQQFDTNQQLGEQRLQQGQQAISGEERRKQIEGSTLLGNFIDRLEQFDDPAVRLDVYQKAVPEMEKFGVTLPPNVAIENMTNEGLAPLKESVSAFRGMQSDQMSSGQREFQGLTQGLSAEDQEIARRIKLGLDPRASMDASEFGLRERSKLEAQQGLKSEIAGDVAAASELGKIEAREGTATGQMQLQEQEMEISQAKLKLEESRRNVEKQFSGKDIDTSAALNNIDQLLSGDAYQSIYGKIDAKIPDLLRSQDSLDAIALRDQVVGLLSLESREKLKGQGTITDSEAASLERSATLLANPNLSNNLAREELERVRSIFSNKLDKKPQGSNAVIEVDF